MSWRTYTDWAKRKQLALRLADHLGRGRGRLRVLDRLSPPPPAPHKPDLSDWNRHELAAVWIGHATVLLRIGAMTVLTDPVLSNRVGIGLGLATGGPKRHFAPALNLRQLPPLDLILISHAHFDHLDLPTLARLSKRIPVVTSHHTRDLIDKLGFRQLAELSWGQQIRFGPLNILAHEVRHWGARTFYDQHRGFNSYVLEAGGRRILFGGDTAYHELFRDIGKVDLAILGIGAYNPYIQAHATPEQAWEMSRHVNADYLLPIHHSTFRLSHEPMAEPLHRLLAAAGSESHRIVGHEIGTPWVAGGSAEYKV